MPRVLTPAKQRAQYALNAEAERLQFEEQHIAACRVDPAPFMDWEDPQDALVIQAQLACEDCPFRANCKARARLEKPDHGVWAGDVYLEGRVVRRRSEEHTV